MLDDFQVMFYKTRRKGIGIVECLILMLILGVAFSAIFITMGWAQRSHATSRHDRESRELLFSWVDVFESLWQPSIEDTPAELINKGNRAVEDVAIVMNGTSNNGVAQIGAFTVRATPTVNDGRLVLGITISSAGRRAPWVVLERSFNVFCNDTVSDDVVTGDA